MLLIRHVSCDTPNGRPFMPFSFAKVLIFFKKCKKENDKKHIEHTQHNFSFVKICFPI